MKNRLALVILVTGFSGIVAQILLLRELLITFLGNELSIGIILANWLILEAFGCFFIGKRIDYIKNKIGALVGVILLFSISLPIAIYLIRLLREILGIAIGEGVGLLPILISTFFILLPVSLSHGALFTFSCEIYSKLSKSALSPVGKVYIYEILGTSVGGIVFTFLLLPFVHSFQIAIGLALINFFVCLVLVVPLWHTGKLPKLTCGILAIFLFLSGYFILGGGADKLHQLSIEGQWRGHNVVHHQNSVYGNITVTESQDGKQYTFFSDGIPTITTPIPDIISVEEFVHLPLLTHPHPQDILIIRGGAGGVINEILKHPSVERVAYAEPDPMLLKIIRKFPDPLTETELNDPRVKVKHIDGLLYLRKTEQKYDLILVGLTDPSNLQSNRFFTKEFFQLTKNRLKEDGILVIGLPSSLAFLSASGELNNLNACIMNTLKSVFPYVRVIPGDVRNLYLSSNAPEISLIDSAQLIDRLKERNLQVSILIPKHIERKLHPGYLDWFLGSVEEITLKINRDFQPRGLFYSISYWNALFSPYMRGLFRWLGKINLQVFFVLISILTVVFLMFRSKIAKSSAIPLNIATTGFAGMTFDLALIFTFQALFGFVFHWLGLLVAAFMVGIAAGATVMISLLPRIKRKLNFFVMIEWVIICFSFILPMFFLLFRHHLDHPGIFFPLQISFLVLSFISGLLVGGEFPLANKLHLKSEANISKTAGLLYGADLFGGFVGGIVGGVVLLPVLGLLGTCLVVVMLKASSLIILGASVVSIKGSPTKYAGNLL